jgi:hypothetical protein
LIAAAGLLFSPSRGLLVFSPVVALAAAGLGTAWRNDSKLRWFVAAAAAQFAMYSMYSVWWAGHTYGPRYLLDLLPLLVPVAAAGLDTIFRSRILLFVAAVTLVWSVLATGAGAFIYPAERWNTSPESVDVKHERLWDWKDSQLGRAARSSASSQNFALFNRYAFRPEPTSTAR